MNKNPKITILLTVHNKEDMVELVVKGIMENISEYVKEFVVVFDGCTDESENIVKSCMAKQDRQIVTKYIYTEDIRELKANNAGLRECDCDYVILVQDDMVIKEKDFDKRMLRPFMFFDDVFAVTAQTAHNNTQNHNSANRLTGYPRDKFAVREIANRGPLMYDYADAKKLGFFDEHLAPNSYDDHDLSYRAYKELKKISGLYWINYDSEPQWGTSRNKNQDINTIAHNRNEKIIRSRYPDLIGGIKNEDRNLPE